MVTGFRFVVSGIKLNIFFSFEFIVFIVKLCFLHFYHTFPGISQGSLNICRSDGFTRKKVRRPIIIIFF